MYNTTGSTSDSNSVHVGRIKPTTIQAASTTVALGAAGRSEDKSLNLIDAIATGAKVFGNWATSGWGNVFDGNKVTGSSAGSDPSMGVETISGSDFKKQGGLGSLFGSLLGGTTGITLGGVASGIGNYFTAKAANKLATRRLDIEEKLGEERNAISRLQAEGNVAKQLADTEENKRRTAIESTFMGHTSPIAAVPGVNVEQGLQVARPAPQAEYASGGLGVLNSSSPGLISQGQQRKVA